QHGDTEVRRIPDMATLHAQDVLRHDRNDRAEQIGPYCRRAHQDAHADPADVRAGQVWEFAGEDAAENQLSKQRGDNGDAGLFVALENPEREMACQQYTSNERGSEIAILRAEKSLPVSLRDRWSSCVHHASNCVAHAGSLIL